MLAVPTCMGEQEARVPFSLYREKYKENHLSSIIRDLISRVWVRTRTGLGRLFSPAIWTVADATGPRMTCTISEMMVMETDGLTVHCHRTIIRWVGGSRPGPVQPGRVPKEDNKDGPMYTVEE